MVIMAIEEVMGTKCACSNWEMVRKCWNQKRGFVSCVNVGQNVNLGELYWRLF